MLLLGQALGPSVLGQRDDVCLALPGRLPDFHRQRQGNSKPTIYYFFLEMEGVESHERSRRN